MSDCQDCGAIHRTVVSAVRCDIKARGEGWARDSLERIGLNSHQIDDLVASATGTETDDAQCDPLSPDDINAALAEDGRVQTRYWWAGFAMRLVATVEAERARAERAETERDAARSVIRHAMRFWLPIDVTAEAFGDFANWTDDDWADSTWTPAEAAEIRAATGQPTEQT